MHGVERECAVAQSPIMVTTITLKRLIRRGYESTLSYYERVSPQLNEPAGCATRTYRGVRGAPRQLQLARPPTRL